MIKERHLNIFVLGLLIFVPIFAYWNDQPFTITLMTRAVIFAIAAVGLNLALGIGGFISFGHAAFFGLGGYVMGILAWHSQNYMTLVEWPILIEGTKVYAHNLDHHYSSLSIVGCYYWNDIPQNNWRLFHNDHLSICSNDVLFLNILERLWGRRWPFYLCKK